MSRLEARAFISDQGAEAGLADTGCVLARTCTDLQDWEDYVAAAQRGELVPDSFLWPLAVYIPDHLHMIFGCVEWAIKGLDGWKSFELALRRISKFLRNHGSRYRFISQCLSDQAEKAILRGYIGDLTDWKWEYMGQFLFGVRRVLPILKSRFDVAKYIQGHEGDIGSMERKKGDKLAAEELREALDTPLLVEKAETLRTICFAVDRCATSLEGCRCHEHLLDGEGKWSDRVRLFRKESASCVWKGRRALDLSLGMLDAMQERIQHSTDRHLRELLASSDAASRGTMLILESSLKSTIAERL